MNDWICVATTYKEVAWVRDNYPILRWDRLIHVQTIGETMMQIFTFLPLSMAKEMFLNHRSFWTRCPKQKLSMPVGFLDVLHTLAEKEYSVHFFCIPRLFDIEDYGFRRSYQNGLRLKYSRKPESMSIKFSTGSRRRFVHKVVIIDELKTYDGSRIILNNNHDTTISVILQYDRGLVHEIPIIENDDGELVTDSDESTSDDD